MFLLSHFSSSTASPHFNAGNDTLSIHVKSLAHDDECGVTFMIKTTERRLQRGWRGSKINLIFMILMILSGIWRGARARKMTTNYMSAEYGVNRWDFSDIMSYVNCWWRRCALRSAVQWDDDVVLPSYGVEWASEQWWNEEDKNKMISLRYFVAALGRRKKCLFVVTGREWFSPPLSHSVSLVFCNRENKFFLYDFTYVRERYNLIQNVWW